jgi:predicted nucleic acid-binding protein
VKPPRLAVDTNVLLDLAGEVDDVLDAVAIIARRLPTTDKLVLPSVLDELAFLADSGQTEQTRLLVGRAMRQLRTERRFRPLLELPVPAAEVEALANEFRRRYLLPEEEVHDAMILAEAAMMSCGLLLSSDEHLRGIDHQELTWLLHGFELAPPVIATPREIAQKFFR